MFQNVRGSLSIKLEKPFQEKAAAKVQELALNAQSERVEGMLICICADM